MKIETPVLIQAPLTTEFHTDPLLGEAGYRVQTAVAAGQTTVTCPSPLQVWDGKRCVDQPLP